MRIRDSHLREHVLFFLFCLFRLLTERSTAQCLNTTQHTRCGTRIEPDCFCVIVEWRIRKSLLSKFFAFCGCNVWESSIRNCGFWHSISPICDVHLIILSANQSIFSFVVIVDDAQNTKAHHPRRFSNRFIILLPENQRRNYARDYSAPPHLLGKGLVRVRGVFKRAYCEEIKRKKRNVMPYILRMLAQFIALAKCRTAAPLSSKNYNYTFLCRENLSQDSTIDSESGEATVSFR